MQNRARQGVAGLDVWWKAREMVARVYPLAARFPDHERFALANQLRRAAVSVPLNIAEGHGRKYIGDYKRSISYACGSCTEIQTLLILASDLGYLSGPDLEESMGVVNDVARMLNRLYAALSARHEQPM
jgi:four helix bundle protein